MRDIGEERDMLGSIRSTYSQKSLVECASGLVNDIDQGVVTRDFGPGARTTSRGGFRSGSPSRSSGSAPCTAPRLGGVHSRLVVGHRLGAEDRILALEHHLRREVEHQHGVDQRVTGQDLGVGRGINLAFNSITISELCINLEWQFNR